MKKGQAALEFLTTYGWALLVILVMIGALVYFGLLNPSRALPSRCDAPPGFQCKDYQITEDSVSVIINNKNGEGLQNVILAVNASDSDGRAGGTDIELNNSCTITPVTVPADGEMTISCAAGVGNTFFLGLTGEKVKAEFEIQYLPARGTYSKTASFSIFAPVQ
jgi:hypothetical protein